MRAENLVSEPIKMSYKVGVYGAMGFVGLSLAAFILWSFTCLGTAAMGLVDKLV